MDIFSNDQFLGGGKQLEMNNNEMRVEDKKLGVFYFLRRVFRAGGSATGSACFWSMKSEKVMEYFVFREKGFTLE